MRKGFRALLVLAVLGSALPANAQVTEFFDRSAFAASAGAATVVDFDSQAAGTVLTGNEFAAQGLTIIATGGPINIVRNLSAGCYGANYVTEGNLNSAPNGISTSIGAAGASPAPADNFDFILDSPRSAAGLYIGNLGNGTGAFLPTTIQFLDEFGGVIASGVLLDTTSGVILGTACGSPKWDNRIFYGITSGIPIKTITVRNGPNDGDGITIDDVQFGQPVLPPGGPPVATAGADQSVNEQQEVTLDGTGSSDPDGDTLTYAWVQIGGPVVTLFGDTTPQPGFTAPFVASGGETLTFELTVTANGETDEDTVSITVVNVNHTPVADAGIDQSIAEGSPVTLDGTGSFDIDTDPISYAWVQESGPVVAITGATTAAPSFTAPTVDGAPGVVATLVFKLVVDDGFPQDVPAPGYTFANVEDTVTVQITNVNNVPTAEAGAEQTVNENSLVTLDGTASSDPDGDTLTYSWVQVGGPVVALTGDTTATPTLTTPSVSAGGADLTFKLSVDDGYSGGSAADTVVIHVQNANDPPLVSAAQPTIACLRPPNHKLVSIGITGVSDPDDDVTITIDSVTQDEPTNGLGDGDTRIDAIINADGTVLLRAERSGNGDGRVYHVHFTASDREHRIPGVVNVCVPRGNESMAIDGGELYDSTH